MKHSTLQDAQDRFAVDQLKRIITRKPEVRRFAPAGAEDHFSLARYMLTRAEGRYSEGYEGEVLSAARSVAGDGFGSMMQDVVPFTVFNRAMATTPGLKGGYLIESAQLESAQLMLAQDNPLMQLGALFAYNMNGQAVVPRVSGGATVSFVGDGESATASDMVLGLGSTIPRVGTWLVDVSIPLLKQAPHMVDAVLTPEAGRAATQAIVQGAIRGAGGAEPLGIVNMNGVASQSGTSLALSGVNAMKKTLIDAGAAESSIASIGGSTAQQTLAGRQRFTGVDRTIWDGGLVAGQRAICSKMCPDSTLVMGDWSRLLIAVQGPGLLVDVDRSGGFNTGRVTFRMQIVFDVVALQLSAFVKSESIT